MRVAHFPAAAASTPVNFTVKGQGKPRENKGQLEGQEMDCRNSPKWLVHLRAAHRCYQFAAFLGAALGDGKDRSFSGLPLLSCPSGRVFGECLPAVSDDNDSLADYIKGSGFPMAATLLYPIVHTLLSYRPCLASP